MKPLVHPTIARLLLIITVLVFAHQANALLITQSFDSTNVGGANIEIHFDPFDSALGTLTSVRLEFLARSVISSEAFNCIPNGAFCIMRGFASVDWLTGDALTSRRYTTDRYDLFLPGESKTLATNLSDFLAFSSSDDLSVFTMSGPSLVAHDWWRCDTNCVADIVAANGTHALTGTLIYEYIPVPATFVLLLLGIVNLAWKPSLRRYQTPP